ncbi:hypothetical protein C8A00DRAFT_12887 [Chaetomidium leptoderma]|uniref:RING-type domain-containing protein n=1 Tax=Chaetomidium leptoderma TaxID=669021 RepID=A0AAN6VRW2_9PEZI|nr:hypothetical protein C8A00DRAFT_12887 [Chaetomidium leptoderma]
MVIHYVYVVARKFPGVWYVAGIPERAIGMRALRKMPVIEYDPEMAAARHPGNGTAPTWWKRLRRLVGLPTETQHDSRGQASRRWYLGRRHAARPVIDQQTCCVICTDGFLRGVSVRRLPCGHLFHPQCVDPWLLDRQGNCPTWQVNPPLFSQLLCCELTRLESISRATCRGRDRMAGTTIQEPTPVLFMA